MGDEVNTQRRLEDSELALKKAIHDSSEVLATASTALTFKRVIVTLNRTKLVAEERSPFSASIIMSVDVNDLQSVDAAIGPLFGTIVIVTKLTSAPRNIGLFWRKDLLKFRRIAHGYIIARQRNIDLDPLPTEELKALLYELGVDDHSIK